MHTDKDIDQLINRRAERGKRIIATIPNIITMGNLFMGAMATVFILQPGLIYVPDDEGEKFITLPEQMGYGSLCILLASVLDVLDGMAAKKLKATSLLGIQLDSLADLISFGLAPACIIYQLLRLGFAQQADGLDISVWALSPAFLLVAASAYRLARFNLSGNESSHFEGVPTPMAGLLIASLPMVYWGAENVSVIRLLIQPFFLYGLIALVSWLLISSFPILSLKGYQKKLLPFYVTFFVASIIAIVILKWLSILVLFILYIILSHFFTKYQQ